MAHRNRSRSGTKIAAFPMRWTTDGSVHVLLVSPRGSKRWLMPRGWWMDEQKSWKIAEIEALNRAGAVGYVGTNPIGRYCFDKVMADGAIAVVEVEVFPMVVERLRRDWKNRRTRKRRWFHVLDAAEHVRETDLAALLRQLSLKSPPRTALGRLFSWFG